MAETQNTSAAVTSYQEKLAAAIEKGLSSISTLEDRLIVDPQTKQDKKTNKQLNKQIKAQQKKVSGWEATLAKKNPAPASSGQGRDFKLADVSDDRLQQDYGVTGFEDPEVQRLSQSADVQIGQAESDVASLRQLGQKLLTGNIPVDVSEAVIRASAAGSLARGITSGSQLARNLTARDLGMTSLDIMSRGSDVLGTTAQLSQGLASFQESRAQYRTQFQLATAELKDAIRKTDLSVAQLAEEKHQFKQKMTLALNQQMIDLALAREELNFKYYATPGEGDVSKAKGPLGTLDNLIGQIRTSLSL